MVILITMVVMNLVFKNEAINEIMAYIVYYSGILLSLAFHITALGGKDRKKVSENAFLLMFLGAAVFSFPFVRFFLTRHENSWIFLSSSKVFLATGTLLYTSFRKKDKALSLLSFLLFPALVVSVVLRVKPVFLEIPSTIVFLTEIFLVRKPLFTMACILFSVSSFFTGKNVYLVHLALGSAFLAWFTFTEVTEKYQGTRSDLGEDLYFILSKDLVHRLKNPLNAISVTAQLIKRKHPEVSELASKIEDLCEKMADQIDHVLKLSTSTTEKVVTKRGLEEELLPILQLARIKGLEVKLELSFEELPIDKNVFTAIVTNIFSNAVKYTGKGGVSLRVRRGDDMIIVEVSDTGPGLRNGQHGMGLTIVERLVEHLGGEMRIRVEGGTVVEIRIPTGRGRDVSSDSRGR